jgi:hypothetical protein
MAIPQQNNPNIATPTPRIHIECPTSTPTAALIGGAAVVVAGVIDRVALLDESVVLEAEDEGDCDCVVELVLKVEDWDVWDVDGVGEVDWLSWLDEGDAEVEVDVMVVSVVSVSTAEDPVEGDANDVAEDARVDATEEIPVMTADEDAMVEEAAEIEIKLPPLLNTVTVAGWPLTTTVDAVTVVSGPALLSTELPLLTLVWIVCVVLIVNENEYVVLGLKDSGNVANADESTESAFVVSGAASVVVDREVMVVNSVVAVVWMGIITATVKDGGIDIVAIGELVKAKDGKM